MDIQSLRAGFFRKGGGVNITTLVENGGL